MYFWLIASVLTLGACVAVMLPFLRRSGTTAEPGAHDLEVYRDQLSELERDAARGLIAPAEAEQARAEIGRRLLALQDVGEASQARGWPALSRSTVTAAVLAVPLLSWGIYAGVGSPSIPDQPLSARLGKNPADSSMTELVARAERHLIENPTDGRGWDVLAPIYLRTGRLPDAVTAFRNSIRLNGATAAREAGLGEAIVGVAGGTVTAEAQEHFERALTLDVTDSKARFFIALGYQQEGRTADSLTLWRQMVSDLPEDNPWHAAAIEAVKRAGGEGEMQPTASVPAGPSNDDIAAAAGMSQEDRARMIEGMVASLDQRLREQPDDVNGWQRLVQSYIVLGRRADAASALERGVTQLGASPQREQLLAFAASLGLQQEVEQ